MKPTKRQIQIVENFIKNETKRLMKEEKSNNYNYYQSELNKVDLDQEHKPSLKITSASGTTNHININSESIPIIINWLKMSLKKLK